jgi:hypothetical protein
VDSTQGHRVSAHGLITVWVATAPALGLASTAFAQPDPRPTPATNSDAVAPQSLAPAPPPPPEEHSERPAPDTKAERSASVPASPQPATTPVPLVRLNPERRWYGWQILLTDGAAVASVAASGQGVGWSAVSSALYLGGGPVVHFVHGNVAKGFGSLGIRVGIPLGGALLGGAIGLVAWGSNGCGDSLCLFSPQGGAIVGAGIGLIATSIVDVVVLAHEDVSTAAARSFGLHLTPVAGLPRDAAGHIAPTFGVAGAF